MGTTLTVTGTVLRRFVQSSTLLSLLNPVRGEPTTHSLDRHPNDTQKDASDRLYAKFLDSIALICATIKKGDAVSAAAIEEGSPEGTIIRVARNSGFPDETITQVRIIIDILNEIVQDDNLHPDPESQILTRIIKLDTAKISHYLEKIRKSLQDGQVLVNWILENPGYLSDIGTRDEKNNFLHWIKKLPLVGRQDATSSQKNIMERIQWAANAKWVYGRFIDATFKARDEKTPLWVMNVYKLGRYGVASKVLVKFAMKNRNLFCPMSVEALPAPSKQSYTYTSDLREKHLEPVLRRTIGGETREPIKRLSRHWNVNDVEEYFCQKCPSRLAVHAELQLINFYDHNEERLPRRRFLGVSKKSCFLCYKFLENHPLSFTVSGCHQKLYPQWLPPPCTFTEIYQIYKRITIDLTVLIESAVRQEMEQIPKVGTRIKMPLDSTAGVSLPMSAMERLVVEPDEGADLITCSPIDIMSDHSHWERVTTLESGKYTTERYMKPGEATPPSSPSGQTTNQEPNETEIKAMVFNVRRADNSRRQDLVSTTDIIDPTSGKPCWNQLCNIIATKSNMGVGFDKTSEFLLINQNLRVGNARQFEACLEYSRNAQSWNNDVLVYAYDEVASV